MSNVTHNPPIPKDELLVVRNLVKYFPIHGGLLSREVASVKAVQGVSFTIKRGETLGLVGESGCGKSTLGRAILRLIEPTSGDVYLHGTNVIALPPRKLRAIRREMQIIFQDPYASLNPRMTVGSIISEPLVVHRLYSSKEERRKRVFEILDLVGLRKEYVNRYPHEFSGGQRQRIGIARALAVNPSLIIADEPVSALDVSIQAQILNLLNDLQKMLNLTFLFISHDLRIVEHVSNRVAVMYLGRIVELAKSETLYKNPKHPYTVALLSAVPIPDPSHRKQRIVLKGDVPSPLNPPPGCVYHTRCQMKIVEDCKRVIPPLREIEPGHFVSCHLAEQVHAPGSPAH
ncbi:MAG TPA: dipeptide ABC transporter ATP-binding protein [Bdellovibrionota bacterium]|nr:dipeptide ABC transporter ATP-binding protein [Bdellovibrionota bacterium]